MRLRLDRWDYGIIFLTGLCMLALGLVVLDDFEGGPVHWNFFDAQMDEFEKNPPTWEECVIDVADIEPNLVFLRKQAHPFLAEYERRLRIEKANEPARVLDLPMNTGGRTHVRVFLIEEDGKKYLRLKDNALLNIVIDIEQAEIAGAPPHHRGRFMGTVMQLEPQYVPGRFMFVNVEKDRDFALSVFTEAAEEGYEKSLKELNAMQPSIGVGNMK